MIQHIYNSMLFLRKNYMSIGMSIFLALVIIGILILVIFFIGSALKESLEMSTIAANWSNLTVV